MNPLEIKLFRRLHKLIVGHFESSLTDDAHAELQALLLGDPAARQKYVEYSQETACLRWLCLEELATNRVDDPPPREGQSKVIFPVEHIADRGKFCWPD